MSLEENIQEQCLVDVLLLRSDLYVFIALEGWHVVILCCCGCSLCLGECSSIEATKA